jgi:peptide/nickel transport system permease protein
MGAYVLRRILISIPILFGITIIAFALLASAPGDPVRALISPEQLANMTDAQIEQRRVELGLDGGPVVRYVRWLGLDPILAPVLGTSGVTGVLEGNFGFSIKTGQDISDIVEPRIGPTLLLMATGLLLALLIGIPLGVIAAVRPYTRVDYAASSFSMLMISAPTFLFGLIFIYAFAVWLRWLPTGGLFDVNNEFSIQGRIAHLVLPATVLAMVYAAPLMRYTRASMLDVLSSEYMVTARAKGIPSRTVLIRHAFRNALIPVVSVVGILLPDVVAGAIVTEQVFNWPGMGQLAVQAAANQDPSLMMAIVLIVAVAVLLSNLIADVAYTAVDPRIRLDSAG